MILQFSLAIKVIRDALRHTGNEINIGDYDGAIIKILKSSNTLDPNRISTHQSHIAITGDQMNLFPYIKCDGYFREVDSDEALKRFYILQIPVFLSVQNLKYLSYPEQGEESDRFLESFTSVVRCKRASQADQIQLSLLAHDDQKFVNFRRCLPALSTLIILKRKETFAYEAYGILPGCSTQDLNNLNNGFARRRTETPIQVKDLVYITD